MTSCAKWNVQQWYEENRHLFEPPICNKLMHKEQLSVMFVGGPNTRTDFHIDESSEFFYQLSGNMSLPTIQRGALKVVHIKAGDVFLLPSRIPHSPQRPEAGSLGLVVERSRDAFELDGLRWYTDFAKCNEILYERYFPCSDLGRDLAPQARAFQNSDAYRLSRPTPDSVPLHKPYELDSTTSVPEPFNLREWIAARHDLLAQHGILNLFPDHPDGEFRVHVIVGTSADQQQQHNRDCWEGGDTLLFQLEGPAISVVAAASPQHQLVDASSSASSSHDVVEVEVGMGECAVVRQGCAYEVRRPVGSVGLRVQQDPRGNAARRVPLHPY